MSKDVRDRLKEALVSGWEIRGFQPILSGDRIEDGVVASTGGYTILLQKAGDVAIAIIGFDDSNGKWSLKHMQILTGAA